MSRRVYIWGTHEPPPPGILKPPCWILHLAEVGHSPEAHSGVDMSYWEGLGYLNILRIQHLWGEGGGCLPPPGLLAPFVYRVRTCVEGGKGCSRWVIGNEPNLPVEWPDGQPIMPEYAALAYNVCRGEIHSLPGHERDEVLLMPVAPWNVEIGVDWIEYLRQLVDGCDTVDGFAIHTYSRGSDPSSITSEDRMDPPYQAYRNGFRTYRDWLTAIPERYKDKPVYITEANQNAPWVDENTGWVRAAYGEIDEWNKGDGQKVYALLLYRWPRYDEYHIDGKQGVVEDLTLAMENEYVVDLDDGEGGMWQQVHYNGLQAFYDQDGEGELTIPVGHRVVWDSALDRPEMDKKDANLGHPEVYSPPYSAVGFLPYATFKWWCYTDVIPVTPGRQTRGRVQLMVVAHGVEGDPNRPGACGMRVGLSEGTVTDPLSASILWSTDWQVVRGSLDNERVWRELVTSELTPMTAGVRLWVQCNADVAADISAGHWDDEVVEQWVEGPVPTPSPSPSPSPEPPPSTGPYEVETYVDGQLVATGSFTVEVEALRIVPDGTQAQALGNEPFSRRLRRAWEVLWERKR